MAFTILNAILTLFIIKFNEQTQIKEFKKSKLSLNFEKTLHEFKSHVKFEYLKDKRIKVIFPGFILNKELHFYIYENLDNKIVLTDFSEMVKTLNNNRTPNKNGIKKVCGLLGVEYDSGENSIILTCTPDKLDESLWTMFSALLVIEYVRY